jgi:hypothetical protein
MSRLMFVPASRMQARELRAGGATGPWLAFLASPGLRAESGDLSVEELDYVALNHAGVAQLVDPSADGSLRLVLAAEVPAPDLLDVDVASAGSATVATLAWSAVVALFADDLEAASAVAAARAAVRGRALSDALAAPEVAALLEAHDLGWYAPGELDRLP